MCSGPGQTKRMMMTTTTATTTIYDDDNDNDEHSNTTQFLIERNQMWGLHWSVLTSMIRLTGLRIVQLKEDGSQMFR